MPAHDLRPSGFSKATRKWVCGAALVTVVGCARYEPRPLEAQKILKEMRDLSLQGLASARQVEVGKESTGIGFDPADGLTEREAVSVGLLANPDLRSVRAERKVAEAQLIAAGLFPDPEIDAKWLSRSDGTVLEGSLLAWMPLLGERGLRKEKARLRTEEVDAQTAAAEWNLAIEIRTAFADAAAAEESLRIQREALDLRERVLSLIEERARLGAAAPLEADLAAIDAGQTRRRIRKAEWESQAARQRLNRLLGLPPAAAWILQRQEMPEMPSLHPERLEEVALLRRWDFAAARKAYEQAEKELALAVKGQYPKLRLGPAYGREEGESGWGIGASLEIPAWNRNRGGIAQAEAERDRLTAAYRAKIGELRSVLASAAVEWELQRDLVRRFDEEVRPRVTRSLERAQETLKAGKVDFLSLVLVQDRVFDALQEDLNARTAFLKARIRLEGALGCPVEEAEQAQGGGQ